jgi:Transglutaminase-like superfamily
MFLLVCRAYLLLIRMDVYLTRRNFSALYEWVHRVPLRKGPPSGGSAEAVCRAVDIATVWYRKQVLCLERSAATACLLRRYGVAAQLVIGAQPMPFRAHAWVEVDGRVIGDKPYTGEIYSVLDRC